MAETVEHLTGNVAKPLLADGVDAVEPDGFTDGVFWNVEAWSIVA